MKCWCIIFMFSLLASAQEIDVNKVKTEGDEAFFELRLETGKQKLVAFEMNLSGVDGNVKTVITGQAAQECQKIAFYDKPTGKLYLFGFNDLVLANGIVIKVVVTGYDLLVENVIAVTTASEELPLMINNQGREPTPHTEPDPPEK